MKYLMLCSSALVCGLLLATSMGTPSGYASSGSEAQAARLYAEASAAIANKEYRKAAEIFEKAYQFDPDPSLLVNAAGAHEADLNDARARMLYWQAYNHPKASDEQKQNARLNIARLEIKMRRAGKSFTPFPTTPATKDVAAAPPKKTPPSQPAQPTSSAARESLKSGVVVRVPRPDVDAAYMLSAMHCLWDGPSGRFTQCSSGHAWGGSANFEISVSASRAVGNGLTVGFQNHYRNRPFCSVEFADVAALKRVNAGSSNVTIWLHKPSGEPKQWSSVRTWMTVVCHGVD